MSASEISHQNKSDYNQLFKKYIFEVNKKPIFSCKKWGIHAHLFFGENFNPMRYAGFNSVL